MPSRHEVIRRIDERYHFPLCLAALDHSTVSTPNRKGELSVDLAVAWNTLMLSARRWAQLFSGRHGPGFTLSAIFPNITRRVCYVVCFVQPTANGKNCLPVTNSGKYRKLPFDLFWATVNRIKCLKKRKPDVEQ